MLSINNFEAENITDKKDEWLYFLKTNEIKAEFTAKGIQEAKVLFETKNSPKN